MGGQTDCGTWKDPTNPKDNDDNKLAINHKLREIIGSNKDLKLAIENFYSQDYDLLNKVKRVKYDG